MRGGDAFAGQTPVRSFRDIMAEQALAKENAEVRHSITVVDCVIFTPSHHPRSIVKEVVFNILPLLSCALILFDPYSPYLSIPVLPATKPRASQTLKDSSFCSYMSTPCLTNEVREMRLHFAGAFCHVIHSYFVIVQSIAVPYEVKP